MIINNKVSKQIWADRYKKGNEAIEDNLKRVAKFCSNNKWEEEEFYKVMSKGLFFPAGRTMSNAGIGKELTLNNCFTLNFVEDSIDDIFDKVKMAAKTHQRGGGTGFEFSMIRPNGTPTSNDAIASGVVSFLHVFDAQTATINQGSRRGANMGVLSVYHPDIIEYINAKSYDEGKLVHFNLSVMVDDDFMKAVENDEEIYLHYPIYNPDGTMIKDESKWTHKKKIKAKELWDLIIRKAYDNGEPGILFYENMNKDNNIWYIEKIVNTNPCGEYLSGVLSDKVFVNEDGILVEKQINPTEYKGACNLGSLFIHNLVKNPFTKEAYIDYIELKNTIKVAVRFLDNIVDKNKFPLKDYENYQKALRTIGLGITGLANAMAMLNIKYGSKESIKFTDEIMNFIVKEAYKSSIQLAKEKGCFPFLNRKKFVQSNFIQKHIKKDKEWQQIAEDIIKYGIRNARLISVAPTGTLSLTFGNNCSSGLEPIFSLEYERKVKIGGQDEKNAKIIKMRDYAYEKWLKNKENNIVSKDIFVTAMDLSVKEHLETLKTVAFHVDMSVSKTINIPTEYSFERAKDVYMYAWKNGIKGCTIFRPNPIRQGVLLTKSKNEKELPKDKKHTELPRGIIYQVDDDLIGKKAKIMTGCGSLHIQAWFDSITGDMLEVFLAKGSDGGCNSYMIGLSRMISLSLRGGVPLEAVIDQLNSVPSCPSYAIRTVTKKDTSKGNSCPVAIGNILLKLQEEVKYELGIDDEISQNAKDYSMKTINLSKEEEKYLNKHGEIPFAMKYNKCPICNEHINHVEGCLTCKSCGWTKC
jgi:ribonucleoside-diphosphate reductase alpha chain